MLKLLSDGLWPEIRKVSRTAANTAAAISYFTTDKYLKLKGGDLLIVDASDGAIRGGITSAQTLRRLHKSGVRLFHYPNLHAKVVKCDEICFVGSGNASIFSALHLTEAAVMTDSAQLGSSCAAFLTQVESLSLPIMSEFLSRIQKIKVVVRVADAAPRRRKIDISGDRIWIVSIPELKADEYLDEEIQIAAVEKEIRKGRPLLDELSWHRWIGTSRFRSVARAGDRLIVLQRKKGRMIPYYVTPPLPVLEKQNRKAWTRFYYTEDDAGDLQNVGWRTFQRMWKKAGIKIP
jgi:hypothetical protein